MSLFITAPAMAAERIINLANGQTVSTAELAADLAQQDVLLLGEVHDNALHHQRRGELLKQLKQNTPMLHVVAEHLQSGQTVQWNGSLLADLEHAGFNAKSWQWPAHEGLFAAIRDAGISLTGGNLAPEQARSIARQGASALPAPLASILQQAPLSPSAVATLNQDLLDGHCGQLPTQHLPAMLLAQRARDAAMFTALQAGSGMAVLVAGNNHVRRDYGIPVIYQSLLPGQHLRVVGFVEENPELMTQLDSLRRQYDYVWITPAQDRPDPCQ
ncbi:ChaN family lipoprotein [Methylovorus menthalis]|uniref:ChaN family lipoprotein n=1 Tax=Methylovorus menthalis TaxID=1002227 RepID=UPI001E5073FD|nr:ChaN family lipoprotein [Methylovorus menthalis]MCB4810005.1 ChaN family lipoprotein [Methylovorus menthalis]